jgi:hypothetical protein
LKKWGTVETTRTLLIVRKRPFEEAKLKRLLDKLTQDFSLDAYTARMNLTGIGLALLKRGERNELEPIGRLLSRFDLQWAITEQPRQVNPPMLVKRFSIDGGGILFEDSAGRTSLLLVGAHVLVIVAGLGGRIIQRIMRSQQWSASTSKSLTRNDQYRTILNDNPVIDLMIMPPPQDSGEIEPLGYFRVIGGQFDPKGLGDRMSQSIIQNMDALMREVKSASGEIVVDLDFGISQLPGCMPEFSHARGLESNFKMLNIYSHYVLQVLGRYHRSVGVPGAESNALADQVTMAVAVETGSTEAALTVGAVLRQADNSSESRSVAVSPVGLADPEEAIISPDVRERCELASPPAPLEGDGRESIARKLPIIAGFGLTVLLMMLFGFVIKSGDLVSRGWSYKSLALGQGLTALVISSLFLWLSTHFFRLKRWIDNTPTSKVRSMAMGMVELTGVVDRAYNLISPVSNVACVWYRIKRYRFEKNANNSQGTWRVVSSLDSGSCPFYLRDETGRVLVDPSDADMRPSHKTTYEGLSVGMMTGSFPIGVDEKVVEEIIPELQRIYVLGFAQPLTKEPKSLRRRTAEKLRALKKDHAALMRYDLDRNGEIDEREWSAAVSHTTEVTELEMQSEPVESEQPSADVAVIAPPDRQLPFVISTEREYRVTKRYTFYSIAGFLMALVSLIAAVARVAKGFGLD